jgi:hypothetical protein
MRDVGREHAPDQPQPEETPSDNCPTSMFLKILKSGRAPGPSNRPEPRLCQTVRGDSHDSLGNLNFSPSPSRKPLYSGGDLMNAVLTAVLLTTESTFP